MLRGNYTARIDVKGRLKVPTEFRRLIEEKHGKDFYITSLTGEYVRIYPIAGMGISRTAALVVAFNGSGAKKVP